MKGGCGMLWEKSTPFDSEIGGQRYGFKYQINLIWGIKDAQMVA